MSVATPMTWWITISMVVVLFLVDFALTRRPHAVGVKEAAWWSAFYLALPLGFGVYLWTRYGNSVGTEFYAGYLVEKSLSVDNLFVFLLLLSAFAVPRELQQRVLLIGIAGALVLRAIFIALGAAALERFSITFLIFGVILLVTAVKVLRAGVGGHQEEINPGELGTVRFVRRFMPVSDHYEGTKLLTRFDDRRALTPLGLVVIVVLMTDVLFAVDSVPAVYGITDDPYLVFATNVFALLGLRALYFLLEDVLSRLVHLNIGLGLILVLIGIKLVLHWAHKVWPDVPTVPTLLSLGLIVTILTTVTITSLVTSRRQRQAEAVEAGADRS